MHTYAPDIETRRMMYFVGSVASIHFVRTQAVRCETTKGEWTRKMLSLSYHHQCRRRCCLHHHHRQCPTTNATNGVERFSVSKNAMARFLFSLIIYIAKPDRWVFVRLNQWAYSCRGIDLCGQLVCSIIKIIPKIAEVHLQVSVWSLVCNVYVFDFTFSRFQYFTGTVKLLPSNGHPKLCFVRHSADFMNIFIFL